MCTFFGGETTVETTNTTESITSTLEALSTESDNAKKILIGELQHW